MAGLVAAIAAPAWAQQSQGLAALQAMDMNHDGAITRAEAQAARARMFDRLDADENGWLDRDERGAVEAGPRADAVNGGDANNDGRVSRAEVMALPYTSFDQFDADSDGVISVEEIEAVRTTATGH